MRYACHRRNAALNYLHLAHFQTEHRRWLAEHRAMPSNVFPDHGFAHGRAPGNDVEVARLQSLRQIIQLAIWRFQTGQAFAFVIALLQHLHPTAHGSRRMLQSTSARIADQAANR